MEFHLYKADKKRKKWSIRGDLPNGVTVKLPGHRDKKVALQMMNNIASLSRSAQFGHLPDPSLAEWIAGLPSDEARRYVELGLLPGHLVDRLRPIDDLLAEYKAYLKTRCKKGSPSSNEKVARIRRIFTAIGSDKFDDLSEDKVSEAVQGMIALSGSRKGEAISKKSQFEYVAAIKSFCMWMVKRKKASADPLEDLEVCGARSAPVRNRRPLTVADFRRLVEHLRSAPLKYPRQTLPWTPTDRLMIYWVAVMTGFRAKELQSLTPAHVDFERRPARITVDGWVAKNGQKATIPIDDRLARALHDYSAGMSADAPLYRIPRWNELRQGFYRDLDAAGVRRSFEDGRVVDFHSLRATAICWWVIENRLHLLDVQYRARLKTLELVQEYVDNYAPDHAALLDKTPLLLPDDVPVNRTV